MGIQKPLFSVLMPTYNRAHLLPLAIKSVRQQSFEDFEIIVSNGGSTDNTKDVIANFNDSRIHYIESKEKLSIGDNYQTALNHATGEYITFLSDDDAFVPVMLERVKRVIEEQNAEVVAFRVSHYYHNGDLDFNRRIAPNTLAFPQFTGEVTKFDTTQAIKLLYHLHGLNNFERNDDFIVSFLANAVYHHSVFSRIKTIRKKLFETTPADLYLAAAVFFVTDWYYCLDEPLHIWSNWSDNATASPYKKGNELREHYEKLLNGNKLDFTPLKFALPHNCSVNAILQAKNDFETRADKTQIDWVKYYVDTYDDLMFLKNMNISVTRELQEFNEALSKESPQIKQQVKAKIDNFRFTSKQFFRKFPLVVRLIKSLIRRRKSDKPILISGEANGFDNALEAANFLAANVLRK